MVQQLPYQQRNTNTMNFNNFTIKSQEAVQQAQALAQGYGHQQIENEHIFKAILEVDENVTPFLLQKLDVNVNLLKQILLKLEDVSRKFLWLSTFSLF